MCRINYNLTLHSIFIYSIFSYSTLVDFMTSGPVLAFEMRGEGAISRWRELLGPTDSSVARSDKPSSIRARFGTGWYITFAKK